MLTFNTFEIFRVIAEMTVISPDMVFLASCHQDKIFMLPAMSIMSEGVLRTIVFNQSDRISAQLFSQSFSAFTLPCNGIRTAGAGA